MPSKKYDKITNEDILAAINVFSTEIEKRFNKIEATMVTKDYLDDKLCDQRDDLVRLMFKEDTKLKSLVNTLHRRKVIPSHEKKRLFSMEPFAQIRQS